MRDTGIAFAAQWGAATAVGWLLAHPLVQLFALETLVLWGSAALLLTALGTLLYSFTRRRRKLDPKWTTTPINTGWTFVAVVCLVLGQPGSIAGVLQWLVLRLQIPACRSWMLASGVAAYVAFLVLEVVVTGSALLVYAIAGLLMGTAQWLVLRRHVPRAGWWVAASIVGYVVGGITALAVGAGLNTFVGELSATTANVLGHTAPNLLGGLLCGAITGFWLARLLRGARAAPAGR